VSKTVDLGFKRSSVTQRHSFVNISKFWQQLPLSEYENNVDNSKSLTYCIKHRHICVIHEQSSVVIVIVLPRDAMRKRGVCCRPVSVQLNSSVHYGLSVTLVYCIQTAKDIVKLLSQPGSPIILIS